MANPHPPKKKKNSLDDVLEADFYFDSACDFHFHINETDLLGRISANIWDFVKKSKKKKTFILTSLITPAPNYDNQNYRKYEFSSQQLDIYGLKLWKALRSI